MTGRRSYPVSAAARRVLAPAAAGADLYADAAGRQGPGGRKQVIRALKRRGWLLGTGAGGYRITAAGRAALKERGVT